MNGFKVGLVGYKGIVFLQRALEKGLPIKAVFSYQDKNDALDHFSQIKEATMAVGIPFVETRRPSLGRGDICFLVGWQYLLSTANCQLIVLHDSLLPAYRGFSPTVTALIKGDDSIGVTALFPTEKADQGPYIAQSSINISYPIKIQNALQLQCDLMVEIVDRIMMNDPVKSLITSIETRKESYSIWRDEKDYEIAWSRSAESIARFVDAVGYPYAGARTYINGSTIIVDDVEVEQDLHFEIRDPGKIWQLHEGCPSVVCGTGIIRIKRARFVGDRRVIFDRVRCRLG